MEFYDLLIEAIRARSPIRFRYEGSDGATGERVGSPHALYAHPTTRNLSCDILQHGGDSASDNVQPFKPFNLKKLITVVMTSEEEFHRHELYDADAPRYVNSIAKID